MLIPQTLSFSENMVEMLNLPSLLHRTKDWEKTALVTVLQRVIRIRGDYFLPLILPRYLQRKQDFPLPDDVVCINYKLQTWFSQKCHCRLLSAGKRASLDTEG